MNVPMATRYEFVPPEVFVGDPMATAYLYNPRAITVEWRGGESWAISAGHGWSRQHVWIESEQAWAEEPRPSEREDDFLSRARYSFHEAMVIAARLAQTSFWPPRKAEAASGPTCTPGGTEA